MPDLSSYQFLATDSLTASVVVAAVVVAIGLWLTVPAFRLSTGIVSRAVEMDRADAATVAHGLRAFACWIVAGVLWVYGYFGLLQATHAAVYPLLST